MIGMLRHRIKIEQPTQVSDGAGGYTESYSTLATVWSRVQARSAKERMFAAKVEHNVTHTVRIRHRTDVSSNMRVVHGSSTLQIRGVIPDERGRWVDLMCEEGPAS